MADTPHNENDDLRLKEDEGELDLRGFTVDPPAAGAETGALSSGKHTIDSRPAEETDHGLNTARLITVSCYRNLPLFGKRQIKDALVQDVRVVTRKRPFRLLAWCVMPEHAHFFTYPRVDDPSPLEIVRTIQQRFAIRVIRRWREIGAPVLDEITDELGSVRVWEAEPQEDVIISGEDEIRKVIALVENKPVRRGLVEDPAHWSWSSARRRAGETSHGVPLVDE